METRRSLKIMALVVSLSALSCDTKTKTNENLENFDWLLGQWKRTNEEQGKATFEILLSGHSMMAWITDCRGV